MDFSHWPFSLIIATATVGFLIYRRYINNSQSTALPPTPSPCHWLLGHVASLTGDDPRRFLERLPKNYGALSLFLPFERMVVLNDYETIREVMLEQGDRVTGRPQSFLFRQFSEDGYGLASNQGEIWREQRRFALSTMRDLGMGKSKVEALLLDEVEHLVAAFRAAPVQDPGMQLSQATANAICALVFARRFDYDDALLKQLLAKMASAVKSSQDPLMALFIMPWLRLVPLTPFRAAWKRLQRSMQEQDALVERLISDVRENRARKNDYDSESLVDAFFTARRSKAPQGHYSDQQLRVLVKDLFAAGLDTTASTLYWALFLLVHHPRVQERVHDELARQVVSGSPITATERSRLPYTHATMLETMRWRTLLPLGVPRVTIAETRVVGFTLPSGTQVCPLIWAIHHDARYWRYPNRFEPENFLTEDGQLSVPKQFMAFSVGKRACAGESLARVEAFIYLANLLRRFRFDKADEENFPDAKEIDMNSVFWTCPQYKVKATPLDS